MRKHVLHMIENYVRADRRMPANVTPIAKVQEWFLSVTTNQTYGEDVNKSEIEWSPF